MPQKNPKRTEEPAQKQPAEAELPDVVGLSHDKKGSGWLKYALAGALAFEAATSSASAYMRPYRPPVQRAPSRAPAMRAPSQKRATTPKVVYVPVAPPRELTPAEKEEQEKRVAASRKEHEKEMAKLDKQLQYEGALKKVQDITSKAVQINSKDAYLAAADMVKPIADGDGFTADQKSGAFFTLGSVYLNAAKMAAPDEAAERAALLRKAEDACKSGVQGYPTNSHVAGTWNTLGKVHAEQGRLEEAHTDQIRALQTGGPNDEAVKDAAKEIQRLEPLIRERRTESKERVAQQGTQLTRMGQLQTTANSGTAKPGEKAKALYELGSAHYDFAMQAASTDMTNAVKHLESSRQALERFVKDNPKDESAPAAYVRLGQISGMEQKKDKAKEYFQLAEESAKIHHNKAVGEIARQELRHLQ